MADGREADRRAADDRDPDLNSGAVPGPEDRESFYDAQRRHRRASWRFTVGCVVALLVMGIALSAVISPLATAAGVIALDLVRLVVHLPDTATRAAHAWASSADTKTPSPTTVAVVVAVLLVPGAVVLLLTLIAGLASTKRAAGHVQAA